MKKVIVGLSGGVDSAAAAYLLREAGYEVIGVTLRTWVGESGEESRCCEIDDARETARILGIPYHAFSCVSAFEEKVVGTFVRDYLRGLTPNPCVVCNREVKWERLLHFAAVLGADLVATGHYASVVRLENGRYTVRQALHAEKDQTYMLWRLTQEQLAKTLMPLGGYAKSEVREIARRAGIPIADKPDSQEICFVPDGDYTAFIERRAEGEIPGEGDFVDADGNVLGRHKGIFRYTVGQRKGLGIALGRPAYVKEIRAEKNEIVLGAEEETGCAGLFCRDLSFMSIPEPEAGETFSCRVKPRYRHPGQPASVTMLADGRCRVLFDSPVRSAAPGQSAVFYDGEGRLVGGGVIERALAEGETGKAF